MYLPYTGIPGPLHMFALKLLIFPKTLPFKTKRLLQPIPTGADLGFPEGGEYSKF